jgi:cytochrome c oxidase assembly protein Cox11
MARTKKTLTDTKVVEGKHVTITHYPNGTATFNWDWKALELEVKEATGSLTPVAKKATKKNLVKETEDKVKKTRKAKSTAS